jgi:hypothetical protein
LDREFTAGGAGSDCDSRHDRPGSVARAGGAGLIREFRSVAQAHGQVLVLLDDLPAGATVRIPELDYQLVAAALRQVIAGPLAGRLTPWGRARGADKGLDRELQAGLARDHPVQASYVGLDREIQTGRANTRFRFVTLVWTVGFRLGVPLGR